MIKKNINLFVGENCFEKIKGSEPESVVYAFLATKQMIIIRIGGYHN